MTSGRGLQRIPALAAVLFIAAFAGDRLRVDPRAVEQDLRVLTSAEMAGRGTGTEGLRRAGEYIAREFASAGAKPLGSSYFQEFPVTVGARLGSGTSMSWESGGQRVSLELNSDIVPFNFSGTGRVSGEVVFAGYGITAPEYDYDDYEGIDARGKVVILLRHEPQEHNADSVFDGWVYTEHSQLLSKAINARRHGAIGVIFVTDTATHGNSDTLEPFTAFAAPRDAGMPYVQVKAAVVEKWFESAGRDWNGVQRDIDRDLRPAGFVLPGLRVSLNVEIERETRTARNVAAYVPGKTDEYVIVGAHYDHLGLGEQFSLAANKAGTVHPGADDNASGTAGVLALARWAARQGPMQRGVLFLAFAGEEIGLLGSQHYATEPLLPLPKAVAMINLDMVGRAGKRKLVVGGTGSGSGLEALVQDLAKARKIEVDTSKRATYGSSDHTTFQARLVPVLFFFTGLHEDYHRPSDTAEKIDARATAQLLDLISHVTETLARQGGRPEFVRVRRRETGTAGGGGGGGGAKDFLTHSR